jgi:hypothetical protein
MHMNIPPGRSRGSISKNRQLTSLSIFETCVESMNKISFASSASKVDSAISCSGTERIRTVRSSRGFNNEWSTFRWIARARCFDRSKLGVKRSTLIDSRGVPLAVAVEGANVPDQNLAGEILDAIP